MQRLITTTKTAALWVLMIACPLITGAYLTACKSTPTIETDAAGRIRITGIEVGQPCVVALTIEGSNFNTQGPTTIVPDGGSATLPLGPSLNQDMAITAIKVSLSGEGCGGAAGTWNYTGDPFTLRARQTKRLPLSDFDRE